MSAACEPPAQHNTATSETILAMNMALLRNGADGRRQVTRLSASSAFKRDRHVLASNCAPHRPFGSRIWLPTFAVEGTMARFLLAGGQNPRTWTCQMRP